MDGKRLFHRLRIQNLLSFGNEGLEVDLQPLNVLIGPNASGKSNLIETIGLLRATPIDLTAPVREGGGISEWLWKGSNKTPTATIEALVAYPDGLQPLRYRLQFTSVGQRLELVDEAIENLSPDPYHENVYFYYRYQHGRPVLNVRANPEEPAGTSQRRTQRFLRREDLRPDHSVLSQRKDPDQYPELTYLGTQFAAVYMYQEWDLGRDTAPRKPQPTDLINDFLLPDASNLGLVLNALEQRRPVWQQLLSRLQLAYEAVEDVITRIQGGTVQIFVHERGLQAPIPATRLSDGTLRYLCLLTILLHPEPPPLICIEEPELGLHPDLMPTLAELLRDAAERTQLIITTHSVALVSALSETPDAVIVCERTDQGSQFRHLDPELLAPWLKRYALGELWQMGEIGGTRW
jgi:predicted ATPase